MKSTVLFCIFALSAFSICFAQSSSNETLTISSYYPSPQGVYRTLKLTPTDAEPSEAFLSPGVMYYDDSMDKIRYYKKTGWDNLTAGGGGGGGGYWNETSSHHIYNTNQGNVGIGMNNPDLPLEVKLANTDIADPVVFRLIKKLSGSGLEQWLSFYMYPRNYAPVPYLDSTVVAYASLNPPRVLELAAGDQDQHIRFNVGNTTGEGGEVMRLVHRNGEHLTTNAPDGRVGIGTTDPKFTLQVETKTELNSPFILRGIADDLRSGIFTITPRSSAVYLTYGCYLRNGQWMHDPYRFVDGGTGGVRTSDSGAKFSISVSEVDSPGAIWNYYCYNGALPPGNIIQPPDWSDGYEYLWNMQGYWVAGICPTSSRTLKENFIGINPDDILGKINQLEVSRWNYKFEDESITHIGPIAEDFYRLFKTGSQEDELHLIDSIGVSLAGVKALSGKLNVQQRKIEEFKREVKGLRAQFGKDLIR